MDKDWAVEIECDECGKQHRDLCRRAVKWLLNMGCGVAVDEITTTATSEICDAIGFNSSGFSIVVEVKCSRADFLRDKLKRHRANGKGMGSYRYFMAPAGIMKPDELPDGWGLVEVAEKVCRIVKGGKPTYRWQEPYPFEADTRAERGLLCSLVRRLRDGEQSAQRIGTKKTPPSAALERAAAPTEGGK
ncbi:hypothetical protein [Mesorhizobium sp. M8A.F.Ca.ET.165.01.1.1]|uniref:hypothetical protein n=1 Tax=Mesorhizobium sp. M8A.F.Ca.ET.165.01.1.1 TaxID=2563960 RepID=UPI001093806B|nr:hypothetical protein [Mesorhizobium sp. M8A.F.Ca.ET.165.01.1.1]TGT42755.1 hypothetical protein EN808_12800 [Mesorhizobium sp. M8A.F.Ca.ET.165.01.1.1]